MVFSGGGRVRGDEEAIQAAGHIRCASCDHLDHGNYIALAEILHLQNFQTLKRKLEVCPVNLTYIDRRGLVSKANACDIAVVKVRNALHCEVVASPAGRLQLWIVISGANAGRVGGSCQTWQAKQDTAMPPPVDKMLLLYKVLSVVAAAAFAGTLLYAAYLEIQDGIVHHKTGGSFLKASDPFRFWIDVGIQIAMGLGAAALSLWLAFARRR